MIAFGRKKEKNRIRRKILLICGCFIICIEMRYHWKSEWREDFYYLSINIISIKCRQTNRKKVIKTNDAFISFVDCSCTIFFCWFIQDRYYSAALARIHENVLLQYVHFLELREKCLNQCTHWIYNSTKMDSFEICHMVDFPVLLLSLAFVQIFGLVFSLVLSLFVEMSWIYAFQTLKKTLNPFRANSKQHRNEENPFQAI